MREDKIRFGIIGVGGYALMDHWPRLRDDGRVDVVAICRRNEKLLAEAAKITGVSHTYTDWREMLEREALDAVLVCTPHQLHAEPTIEALRRDLHVLVEKPMATTMADATEMISAANSSKGKLMIGYNRRCDPIWRTARKIIREGAIGKVRQVSAVTFSNCLFHDTSKMPKAYLESAVNKGQFRSFWEDRVREGGWRSDPTAAGGGWFVEIQTHRIDLMLWLAGARPTEVSCFLDRDGMPVERAITTQARLENGVLFTLSFTNGVDADPKKFWGRGDITITGDSGVILANEGSLGVGGEGVELICGGERQTITSDENTGGTTGMFVDLIENGGDNPAPPEECAWTVELTEASYRSAEEKRLISLG